MARLSVSGALGHDGDEDNHLTGGSMKSFLSSVVLTVLVFATPIVSFADVGSQFVFAGIRTPDADNVDKFRFSLLYAKANRMSGFDLGFAAVVEEQEFKGFGPLFAIAYVSGNSEGCLCSFANFVDGNSSGVNAGFINVTTNHKDGANIGLLNVTRETSSVDISGLGISKQSDVQVGLINVTDEIKGVQVGLLNFAKNGFFPVFPFFNYPKSN